jgi:methylated-DNA-[protein]-cysteine S-methyltransferase
MSADAGIFGRELPSLDRYVQFGEAQDRIISVSFPREPDEAATGEHALLDRIAAYLEGEAEEFADVVVALTVPTEQRRVLETVQDVPYGEQVDCGRLANMVPGLSSDDSEDVETIRTALAANPAPLLIPDHRVRDGPSGAPPEVEQRLRAVEGL